MPPTVKKQTTTTPSPTPTSKSNSVLDRIAPIGFPAGEGIKVLLYGASGTGKTTFWGTFPGPILAVVCSGGFKPGELRSLDTPEHRAKVKQVTLHSSEEFGEVLRAVPSMGLKTLVLDHVSGLQDLILKELLGLEELPAQKFFGMASQQVYGTCTQQCKEYLRTMLNLSCNVVIIGQERTFGGREDGMDPEIVKPTVGAAVAPSLAGWLNPACDYVLQMFKRPRVKSVDTGVKGDDGKPVFMIERLKGVDYCARTEPHDVYTTKFRVPKGTVLPDVIVDPSYDKLMKLIKGGGK